MQVFKFKQVDSTQILAKKYLENNQKIAAFITESQTSGYGKQGRNFYSPKTGIYFSVAYPKFVPNREKISLLTLRIATEVVECLQVFFPDKEFKLKWVNDIYLDGKKVAGVLTELSKDGLVVGVGINVQTRFFPEEIRKKAGGITSDHFDKEKLTNELLKSVEIGVKQYSDDSFLKKYRQLSNVIGKNVVLEIGKRKVTGLVDGIDNLGRLVIMSDGKETAYSSGEISKVNVDWTK